jgi:hypothetical protein
MKGDPAFVIAVEELIDGLRGWRQNDPDLWTGSAEELLLFRLESAITQYRADTTWKKHMHGADYEEQK